MMRSQNPHSNDDCFDQEVQSLRVVRISDKHVEKSILALQNVKNRHSARRIVWSLSASVMTAAVAIIAVQLVPQRASAAEIHLIARAQLAQQTRFCRSYQRDKSGKLFFAYEEWLDGKKHSQKFYDRTGKIEGFISYDGSKNILFHAAVPEANQPVTAAIDDNDALKFPLETVDDYMQIPALKTFTRVQGVKLDGRVYDLYSFGHGTYRLYVNPQSRLPVRREIFDKDYLIERDDYEYPKSVDDTLFEAVKVPGVTYYDYPANRAALYRSLTQRGKTKTIDSNHIELKAVLRNSTSVYVVWSEAKDRHVPQNMSSISIGGYQTFSRGVRPVITTKGKFLVACSASLMHGETFSGPLKINIPVFDDAGRKSGTATFDVEQPFLVPDPDRLIWRPISGESVAQSG